jgi:signal-transduction protein with cAMP-binding, CBS, and nucleotidyltransferase domain
VAYEKTEIENVSLRASDVMVKEAIMIDENASVGESADVMNNLEISSIITTRNGKPIGIITERDLLKRIVAEGKDAKNKSQRHHVKPVDRHKVRHAFGGSNSSYA